MLFLMSPGFYQDERHAASAQKRMSRNRTPQLGPLPLEAAAEIRPQICKF
jgi:hypothetical protein